MSDIDDCGDKCLMFPRCKTLREMAERHGTPSQFRIAAQAACDSLMITPDEMAIGVAKYEAAWRRMFGGGHE